MNDRLNNSKGFLKDKLGNYQEDPPEQVWDTISSRLGGRSRRGFIIIGLSAAATIALAVTLGINFFSSELPEETGIAEAETGIAEAETGIAEAETGITDVEPAITEIKPGTSGLSTQGGKLEERVVQALEEIAREESVLDPGITESTAKEALALRIDKKEEEEGSAGVEEVIAEPEPDVEPVAEPVAEPDAVPDVEPELDVEQDIVADESSEDVQGVQITADVESDPDKVLEPPLDPGIEFEDQQIRDKRWMLGASLSPLYSFRDAEATALNGAAEHESGLVSYAGGIQVGYKAGKRLAIESGIFFNKMGVSIGSPGIQLFDEPLYFTPMGENANRSNVKAISNSVGNIVSNSGDIFVNNYKLNASDGANSLDFLKASEITSGQEIRQHLDYLEVPFNLRYTVIDRSVELQLVGGMSTNLLVNNYVSMETTDGTADIGYLTNIRSVNYSGNAGLGMVYHIKEHFSLMMEPRFRYFLNSINDSSLPSTRPYTFGIYTGLSYRF